MCPTTFHAVKELSGVLGSVTADGPPKASSVHNKPMPRLRWFCCWTRYVFQHYLTFIRSHHSVVDLRARVSMTRTYSLV